MNFDLGSFLPPFLAPAASGDRAQVPLPSPTGDDQPIGSPGGLVNAPQSFRNATAATPGDYRPPTNPKGIWIVLGVFGVVLAVLLTRKG